MQTKKGFILIYTILVGIICLIIMMCVFGAQMSEVKYSTSNKKYILKEDNYQRDKEYLMTLLFTYINENKDKMKADEIAKGFCESTGDISEYKTAKVSYLTTNEFIFKTSYKNGANRNDYFKIEAIGKSFKMTFIKTEYYD